MRNFIGLALLAVLATSATAVVLHQSTGAPLLAAFGKSMNDAKTLSATYTLRMVGTAGGSPQEAFSVALKKPNLARFESSTQTIVLDGKQVTTYSKAQNTYYRHPQAEGDMNTLFNDGNLWFFLGFFDPNAYSAPTSRALGPRQMNGSTFNVVEATSKHVKTTLYLDPTDNVARTETSEYQATGGPTGTLILHATALDLNASLPDSTFTFTAPAGARELSLDEIDSDKWHASLDEACKIAGATHKKVFIDFMATWCGPCHMLESQCFHTDTFKSFTKNYVLCRIDVDDQPALASQYGASAIPLQVIADSHGGVIDRKVGYGDPDDFYAFLRRNAG